VNRFAVDVDGRRERASATLEGLAPGARTEPRTRPRDEAPRGVSGASPARAATLREQQLWFARAVMTPESAPTAVTDRGADAMLTAGPRMSALYRLEIYRRGYHARLIECLADDYPVLQHALGERAFEDLCRAYIAAHPSDGPSLNFFGRHMAAFCRGDGGDAGHAAPLSPATRAFAGDLAELEWTIVEVIHAPGSEPLTVDGLRDVPMEAWAEARLIANPSSRLRRFEHPVNAYFQHVRSGGSPPIPGPAPSATVVYRGGSTVWRMDLTVPMFEVLSSLGSGESLGTSLERAQERLGALDEEEAARRVLGWFREWVASGLFARVDIA
jgi:Putative DNA-binding domain